MHSIFHDSSFVGARKVGIDGAQGALGLAAVLAEYRAISMAARNFAARTRVEYARDLAELVAFLLGIEIAEPAN